MCGSAIETQSFEYTQRDSSTCVSVANTDMIENTTNRLAVRYAESGAPHRSGSGSELCPQSSGRYPAFPPPDPFPPLLERRASFLGAGATGGGRSVLAIFCLILSDCLIGIGLAYE